MTEQEWLECTDPQKMLRLLNERDARARKFRLFSCGCSRRLWLLMSGDAQEVVLDAERFADGLLSEQERREREERFRTTFPLRMTPDSPVSPSYLANMVAFYTIWSNSVWDPDHTLHLNEHGASCVSHWGGFTLDYAESANWDARLTAGRPIVMAETAIHCNLLRDIFGNPFRLVVFDAAWRTPDVVAVAQAIYAERRFADLPVLADALEEAGCASADILSHLRGGGEHVSGCWALDLVLGKE